jgi:hypothetical protein
VNMRLLTRSSVEATINKMAHEVRKSVDSISLLLLPSNADPARRVAAPRLRTKRLPMAFRAGPSIH